MKFFRPKILSILAGFILIITVQTVYSQSIRITQPNGGENWRQNSFIMIFWNAFNIPSTERVSLYLLKNGNMLGPIAVGIPVDPPYFTWMVGTYQGGIAPPGTGYQVFITTGITPDFIPVTPGQIGPNVYQDISDATFTITAPVAPSIKIKKPNGGEEYVQTATYPIEWTQEGIPVAEKIRLELLKDGNLLGTIVDNIPIGSYDDWLYWWKVGNYQGGTAPLGAGYTIRIRTTTGPVIQDTSDGPFKIIAPYIRIYRPNGGENWQLNSKQWITWGQVGLPVHSTYAKIELLKDGNLLGTIANNIHVGNSSGYSWEVGKYQGGTAPAGSGYTIRMSITSGPALQDTSNGPFTIIGPLQKKVFVHPSSFVYLNELCMRINCAVDPAPPQPFKMSDAKARQYLAIRQEAIQLNNKSKNAPPAEKEKIEKRAQELLQQLKKLESSK